MGKGTCSEWLGKECEARDVRDREAHGAGRENGMRSKQQLGNIGLTESMIFAKGADG